MAFTITRTRGRGQTRAERRAPHDAGRFGAKARKGRRAWAAERGATHWEGTGDVLGGFPGSAARGGRLNGAEVRITDRYVLIDEGRSHGFGVPLRWLVGAHAAAPAVGGEPLLRLAYGEGTITRTFDIHFRAPRLVRRGAGRAERALAALHAAGFTSARVERPAVLPAATPTFTVPWDETRRFEQENVIWSGRATAPLVIRGEDAAVDVWLTTRSLIWGTAVGEGVNRLPLALVRDVVPAQLEDRDGTPALFVAFGQEPGERYDLPFRFDRHPSADRNLRERGAFLVGLRSRGIPLGVAPSVLQPWHVDAGVDGPVHVEMATDVSAAAVAGAPDDAGVPHGTDGAVAAATEPGTADAVWSGWPAASPPAAELVAPPAVEPTPEWHLSTAVAVVRVPGGRPVDSGMVPGDANDAGTDSTDEPLARPAGVPLATVGGVENEDLTPGGGARVAARMEPHPSAAPDLPRSRAYEAAALASLADVLRAVDGRVAARPLTIPVMPSGQAAALAELEAAATADVLTPAEVAARTVRVVALGEAVQRLRALLELRDAGHLSDGDLALKRAAVLGPLSRQVLGAGE